MRRTSVAVLALLFTGSAIQTGVACSAVTAKLTVTPLSGRPGDVVTIDYDCTEDPPLRQLWTDLLDGVPLHPPGPRGTVRGTVRADATPDRGYWIALDCAQSYGVPNFTVVP